MSTKINQAKHWIELSPEFLSRLYEYKEGASGKHI